MKTFLLFSVLTCIVNTPKARAAFGHVAAERQQRLAVEQQLEKQQVLTAQQQETNRKLHTTISVLSAGVVVSLIIGTAVGSKTRKDHETRRL